MAVRGKHGALLANRYRLLEQLGEGGMGSVWRAEHLALDRQVAIKLIDPDVARLELNLGRFLREAKTLATLRSPHVVQVLDFGSDAEMPYLVMELLHGQTLGRRLLARGRLSLAETSQILSEVCTAISLVHEQGLIHRDLKPDNIFLCEVGDRRVAKVVDFGIAKAFRGDLVASMKTRTGHMLGTPSYMSPEQCRGRRDIDHRADLWALGVIAYECLLGRVPFEGEVLGDLLLRICMDPLPVPSEQPGSPVSREFDAWFARAVSRDRRARFQSAAELAAALAALPGAQPAEGGAAALRSSPQRSSPQRSSPRHEPASGAAFGRSSPSAAPPGAGASPSASSSSSRTADTDTHTTMGLPSLAQHADRRTLRLALGGAAAGALVAVAWALGPDRGTAAAPAASREVAGLRPAYAPVPKVIQPRVATGRRLPSASAPAAALSDSAPSDPAPSDPALPDPVPSDPGVPDVGSQGLAPPAPSALPGAPAPAPARGGAAPGAR